MKLNIKKTIGWVLVCPFTFMFVLSGVFSSSPDAPTKQAILATLFIWLIFFAFFYGAFLIADNMDF